MNTTARICTVMTAGALALASGAAAGPRIEASPAAPEGVIRVHAAPVAPEAAGTIVWSVAPTPAVAVGDRAHAGGRGGSSDGIAWAAASPKGGGEQTTRHVIVTNEDGETYELRIEGGKQEVKVNGKRVGEDRVVREGRYVVVLGEEGKPRTRFLVEGSGGVWTTPPAPPAPPSAVARGPGPKVMLGINQSEVTEALRYQLGLGEGGKAILVERVIPGLPAEKAGLKSFDVIVSIEGSDGATSETLRERLIEKKPGETLKLVVISKGERKPVEIRLAPYDAGRLGMGVRAPVAIGAEHSLEMDVETGEQAWPGDWTDYGREMSERAREEVLQALKRSGVAESDDVKKELELAFKQAEEAFKARSHDLERHLADAHRQMMELRGNRLVVPGEFPGRLQRLDADMEQRLAELERRLEGLEERLNDRMERMMDRLEAMLERYEDD